MTLYRLRRKFRKVCLFKEVLSELVRTAIKESQIERALFWKNTFILSHGEVNDDFHISLRIKIAETDAKIRNIFYEIQNCKKTGSENDKLRLVRIFYIFIQGFLDRIIAKPMQKKGNFFEKTAGEIWGSIWDGINS